jgi:hypothetical protein
MPTPGIKALVDGNEAGVAHNDVKAVCSLDAVDAAGESHPHERHYTVTDEGVIVDIVVDGEVVASKSFEHNDLLDWSGDEED